MNKSRPPPTPPPGWYPDPSGGPGQRYWDGSKWTDVNVPSTPPPIGPPIARRSASPLKVLLIIGAVMFALVGGCAACVAAINGHHSSTSTGEAYSNDDCDADITPKKDGICMVSGGGFMHPKLVAGWIRSAGPRDPAHYPNCMWERLSGPDPSDLNMIIASDLGAGSTGPTEVHIEKTDYAFWSKGCQPWELIG